MEEDLIVVSSKIERIVYSELLNYCNKQKITPSGYIRKMIEQNINKIVPINKAGVNKIDFNKEENCFSWKILYDDGTSIEIADKLSDCFLKNLKDSIDTALSLRNEYIHKRMKESVVSPNNMPKLEGRGENVKC